MNQKRKEKQTFIVEIIDHQKCTWQGQVHWIQGNKKVSFRSVIELLHLMDSAIAPEDNIEPGEAGIAEEK